MRKTMSHIFSFTSIIYTLFVTGCKDTVVNPPPPQTEKQWEEIPLFKNVDIRYMVQHNGVLYVSTYSANYDSPKVLYMTKDGITWDTLKTFERTIGPIAFHEDTLTILESGRTWKYHPSFGWKMFWEHYFASDQAYDMYWLNDELFVYANRMSQVFSADTIKDLYSPPQYSKFLKHRYEGEVIVYTRPFYVYKDNIYRFDGKTFEIIMNGISANENKWANWPTMYVYNDTFYAGFNTPSRIKKLVNNIWVNVTDTIPNTPHADIFSPSLINRPTSIVFHQNRMFVGTEWTGVLAWTDSGWVSISKGLRLEFPDYPQYELYTTVVQMESFRGKIFIGYGEPWFAPGSGRGKGIYYYTLE